MMTAESNRDPRRVDSWAEQNPVSRRAGLISVLSGCLVFSLNGVVARQFEYATTWQIIFYRALFLLCGLTILYATRHRQAALKNLRAVLPLAVLAGPLQGVGSALFIVAITSTTVANVMLVLSMVPLLAAVLGAIALREPIGRSTLAAIGISSTGVFVMTVDGIAAGYWLGSLAALGNSITFAIFIVLLRRGQGFDMLPAVAIGAASAMTIGYIMADGLHIPAREILLCLIWGAVIQCIGMSLVTYGSRSLRAAEISLLTGIEFVMAPIWTWAAVGETPSPATLLGGSIVFAAVLFWSLLRLRSSSG
jgi:DME family drug/metabolite transporter